MTDSYGRLADRLRGGDGGEDAADRDAPTVTAFPDGSVDAYCRIGPGGGGRIDSREAFARSVAGDSQTFQLTPDSVEPGGQAVNVARQADALGADVTLFGHLDDPLFADLSFDARSMGDPARIDILRFEESDLMLSTESEDLRDWSFADLEAAADDLRRALTADVVCATNWTSVPGLGDALRNVAAAVDERADGDAGGVFLLDAGDVVGCDAEELVGLRETLAALADRYEVVLSANEAEIGAFADAFAPDAARTADDEGDSENDRLRAVREAAGIAAAVVHGVDRAAAATGGGVVSVPNLELDSPAHHVGGGDRFGAGLAHARALGWDWELALALGNACSSRYVGSGETGTAAELADYCETAEEGGAD